MTLYYILGNVCTTGVTKATLPIDGVLYMYLICITVSGIEGPYRGAAQTVEGSLGSKAAPRHHCGIPRQKQTQGSQSCLQGLLSSPVSEKNQTHCIARITADA